MVMLTVQTLTGKTIDLNVKKTDTIAKVRQEMTSHSPFPYGLLCFSSRVNEMERVRTTWTSSCTLLH